MAWKNADRVQESTTTVGTGSYSGGGAVTGYQSLSVLGNGSLCSYFVVDSDGVNWEVGIGTVSTGPTALARTQILASSNSGAAVDWGVGTKYIRIGIPADLATRKPLESRTSNTILAQADFGKTIVVTGASTFTQTLTAAATLGDGWRCKYKNAGSGVVTLDPNGAETVNGAATLAVQPGQGCDLWCNGTVFYAVLSNSADGNGHINGVVTQVATAGMFGYKLTSAAGDAIRLIAEPAGTGAIIDVVNNGSTDFEPLTLIGEFIALKRRTGVGTSSEAARIDTSGNLLVGQTTADSTAQGVSLRAGAGPVIVATSTSIRVMTLNRLTDDGDLISFQQGDQEEGTISVSGTTVSLNGAHLGRYAQWASEGMEAPPRGTVLASTGEKCRWLALEWVDESGVRHREIHKGHGVPGQSFIETIMVDSLLLDERGRATTVEFRIVKTLVEEDNEQLVKVKISDTPSDRTVYAVFDCLDDDAEPRVAGVGDFVVRVTGPIKNGDLLESAGDGTARAQVNQDARGPWTIGKAVMSDPRTEDRIVPCLLLIG